MTKQNLPDYVSSAQPVARDKRMGWLTTTSASYAGIMLWFVFWQDVPTGGANFAGGTLAQGLFPAIAALVISALICFLGFYLVPGFLGMKTGLPLSIVGTSTYGVTGGFFMPGFLMGVLQFGWVAVNAYFSGKLIAVTLGGAENEFMHLSFSVVWAVLAGLVGLSGIRYVGMFASYMPILPLFVLGVLLAHTVSHLGDYDPAVLQTLASPGVEPVRLYGSSLLGVFVLMGSYIIGFFATAGAAGCDFGMNNKDAKAVWNGGLVGVFLVTLATGLVSLLVVVGALGTPSVVQALQSGQTGSGNILNPVNIMGAITGEAWSKVLMILLVLAAFPSACFSTFIASNSFKMTLPKVNPWYSCGSGILFAIILILTTYAGKAGAVFTVIGASFGPVCGSMVVDYLLAGRRWAGPRAGFNMAGWLAWILGFVTGSITLLAGMFGWPLPFAIPCPPLMAFLVGAVFYYLFAKMGLESKVLEMPQRIDTPSEP